MGKIYCCATSCHNHSKTKGITLHRIPADRRLRSIWLGRIGRLNFTPSQWTRLCSSHFRSNRCTPGKLPTIFDHKIYKLSKFGASFSDETSEDDDGDTESINGNDKKPGIAYEVVWLPLGESCDFSGNKFSADDIKMWETNFIGESQGNGKLIDDSAPVSGFYFKSEESEPTKIPVPDTGVNDPRLALSLLMHDYCCRPRDFKMTRLSSVRSTGTQCSIILRNRTSTMDASTSNATSPSISHLSEPEVTINKLKSDEDIYFYTGLPRKSTFFLIFNTVRSESCVSDRVPGTKLQDRDELLMTLMKLRLNLLNRDLSYRFKVSEEYVSHCLKFWITQMEAKLSFLCEFPTNETVQVNTSSEFQPLDTIRAIIDSVKVATENPACKQERSESEHIYSDHKSNMTWKALVAVSPLGAISFVSDLFDGNTSGKDMVKDSHFLDLLNEEDRLVAHKDFVIAKLCLQKKLRLLVPSRTCRSSKTNSLFLPKDVNSSQTNQRLLHLQDYAANCLERIREFRILQLPISLELSMAGLANPIFKVCCYMTNLNLAPPLTAS